MQNDLKEYIEGLAAGPSISHEQRASLIEGWDKYFARVQIANGVEQERVQGYHAGSRASRLDFIGRT